MPAKPPTKKAPAKKAGAAAPAGIPFHVSAEAHQQRALRLRKSLVAIASKIEDGTPLNTLEVKFAAGAIRTFAESVPLKPKGKQGLPPKFCHGSEAVLYASYRVQGMKHGQALAMISDRVGASEQAVEKAIKKHRAGAFAMFGKDDPGNQ